MVGDSETILGMKALPPGQRPDVRIASMSKIDPPRGKARVFGTRHLNYLAFSIAMPAARLVLRQLTFVSLTVDKRGFGLSSAHVPHSAT